MRRLAALLLFVAALHFGTALAPASAADKIGVVLMHGKTGTAKPRSPIGPLIAKLQGSGILVDAPDMPWSRSRFLDKDYAGAMAEIDAAVARLKKRGATKIVVGGQSMGANAALGYGAQRDGLAGIMALAPGHVPDLPMYQNSLKHDYRRAKAMVDKGEGEAATGFADNNQRQISQVRVKARIYLSWYDPEGAAAMPLNASKLKPGTPLMWAIGRDDALIRLGKAYVFDRAPADPKSLYLEVAGGHRDTPEVAASQILNWLRSL